MSPVLKSILAVVVGGVASMVVNGTLINVGPMLVPPPPGVDVRDAASIKAGIHLFEPKHFAVPFLAHALGTFVGALVAFLIAGPRGTIAAYIISALGLLGGIAASMMIPAPAWFIGLDLLVAYFPMGWLAIRLGQRLKARRAAAKAGDEASSVT
jgi:hypothetical protein